MDDADPAAICRGEVFPRWGPFLHGRRVPIPFAVVPASPVSVLVTTAGLMFARLTLTGKLGTILGEGALGAENWAARTDATAAGRGVQGHHALVV